MIIRKFTTNIEAATPINGVYKALIAVNDDVDDGAPIDLKRMDLSAYRKNPVVLFAHNQRDIPVGKSISISRNLRGLSVEFEFLPKDPLAERVKNAWDRGFLRAASIAANLRNGIHELLEWSIVCVPADRDAVRSMSSLFEENNTLSLYNDDQKGDIMDKTELRSMIKEVLDDRSNKKLSDGDMAERLTNSIGDAVVTALESVENRRKEVEAKRAKEEEDFEERVQAEVEARMKKKMDGDKKMPMDDDSKKAKGDDMNAKAMDDDDDTDAKKKRADDAIEARADLILLVRDLLPRDFDRRGKSTHEILIAAVGEEIKDASERSEDYLLAKVEDIVDRRSRAKSNIGSKTYQPAQTNRVHAGGFMNMSNLRRGKKS